MGEGLESERYEGRPFFTFPQGGLVTVVSIFLKHLYSESNCLHRAMVVAAGGLGPVSVKMRSGYEDTSKFEENLLAAQEAGASFVTVHPRTKVQTYDGRADWSLVARASQLLNIPVVRVCTNILRWVKDSISQLITEAFRGVIPLTTSLNDSPSASGGEWRRTVRGCCPAACRRDGLRRCDDWPRRSQFKRRRDIGVII